MTRKVYFASDSSFLLSHSLNNNKVRKITRSHKELDSSQCSSCGLTAMNLLGHIHIYNKNNII